MLQVHAFVLKTEPAGEIDRRYFLLTKEFGKIEAIAKAVRKPRAKLAGHLEPVNFSWVGLIPTKAGLANGKPTWQITQALELESFSNLKNNPLCLRQALCGSELLHEFLVESSSDEELWQLWEEFIYGLEKNADKPPGEFQPDFFFSQFALRLVSLLGFLPDAASLDLHPKTLGVLSVILKKIWLPQSSEEEEIIELSKTAIGRARKLMI
ncbi:MAG: recombination protein O N-terminal domain-containing protein [Parcubacteria group bacterium]|nr:recombination protein O N-terminal domain-containing protein [Parcubacteria group bacterium]